MLQSFWIFFKYVRPLASMTQALKGLAKIKFECLFWSLCMVRLRKICRSKRLHEMSMAVVYQLKDELIWSTRVLCTCVCTITISWACASSSLLRTHNSHIENHIFTSINGCIKKIGELYVVQVMTNLTLQDIAKPPKYKAFTEKAGVLLFFIYSHHGILALMYNYTHNQVLMRLVITKIRYYFS